MTVATASDADLQTLAIAALAMVMPEPPVAPEWSPAMLPAGVAALRARPRPTDRAAVALADRLRLSDAELLALALLMAVERDAGLCRAVAAAQAPVAGSRPVLGLFAAAFAGLDATPPDLAFGEGVASGLFLLGEEPLPLPERSLRLHLPSFAALEGHAAAWEGVTPTEPDTLRLPASVETAAARHARALEARPGSALVVRAAARREAMAAAGRVAAARGFGLAAVRAAPPAGLGPWLIAAGCAPCFDLRLGLGEGWELPRIVGWEGSCFVAAGLDGRVEARGPCAEWIIPVPRLVERKRLWRMAGCPPAIAERAAQSYRQGAGPIAEGAERAAHAAAARGARQPGWEDVVTALSAGAAAGPLEALARRVHGSTDDAALVLEPAQRAALDRLLDRCRLRDGLGDDLGPAIAARYRPGVRGLLHGPSGTGKTLAAQWLAGRLGLPLYRVDLAALTSKWIGETEKNLSAVLSAAEHADVLLFFDEADALFAARTEVGDANDRFANAQTNFLLQRIEAFDGIALLASNGRDRFDPAFIRRLDAIIAFDPPNPAARRALWQAHLGKAHSLDAAAIDRLAVTLDLTGGHIRNVVLAALARARVAGRLIGWPELVAAAAEEYAKLGRAPPAGWG